MLLIAVVQLAGISPGFLAADEMRAEVERAFADDENFGPAEVGAAVRDSLIQGVVLSVLVSAVWTGMALAYRAGRRWARSLGLTMFVLYTMLLSLPLFFVTSGADPGSAPDPGENMLIATPAGHIAMWVVAFVVVVLSYTQPARLYFDRKRLGWA